jgi:response regulator RpfG family c-di-GMP phosphodiesterase
MSTPADNKGSILVVDDEEIVLAALRETLRREGYDVTTVSNPVAALELLQQKTFAVILTDQQMPQLTGLEFLAQAKSLQPEATRILITAVLSLNTVIDSINKGEIYRFIVKPWLREELLVTISNAVQRFELIRRNRELQAETAKSNADLAAQVARVAEQNQQLEKLNAALRQNLGRSVQLCLKTIDSYWPVLSNQASRVQELCRALSDSLSLSAADRQVLDIAALLHDIGLIEVPRELIRRWQKVPASLNDAERVLVEHHPVLGQELVSFVEPLEDVGRIIRAHHERFDGLGYPDRRQGADIPWLARLLGVAVAYATYPYEGNTAIEFVKANSGTAFDPEAVRAFVRCLPHVALPRRQREVLLSELRPGMVLARGIYTSGGLLLVSKDQLLSDLYIERLRHHDEQDPINQSLIVFG